MGESRKNLRVAAVYFGYVALLAASTALARPAAAEQIKIGLVKTVASGPLYIAQEKGYFTAEGLTAELVYFETAQPVAVAVVSKAIDFGVAGATAAFYTLAGEGAEKIIGGFVREAPGFGSLAYVVSNRAYAAGFRSDRDFPGHSVALPVIGSPPHYCLALLAAKFGFDLKSLHLLQFQTNANQVLAVSGGQADAGVIQVTAAMPAISRGDVKLLGYCGDETPWQFGIVFTATKAADEQRDRVARFLRVYRRAVAEFHDAFTGADGTRRDGPAAPEILGILVKYTGQTRDLVKRQIPYIDPQARLDIADILGQIDWYRSQNLLQGRFQDEDVIDRRYVIALPP